MSKERFREESLGYQTGAAMQTDLRNAGAEWVDQEVVHDSNLVTSRKPDDIPACNAALVKLFAGRR
ncbi:hypothetical protein BH24ACT9_BH24ACT9_11780 [soil metagenome]